MLRQIMKIINFNFCYEIINQLNWDKKEKWNMTHIHVYYVENEEIYHSDDGEHKHMWQNPC